MRDVDGFGDQVAASVEDLLDANGERRVGRRALADETDRGEIQKDLSIAIGWADVPRGGNDNYGTLTLKIGPDSAGNIQITKVSETGTGFGNTVWTRCQPGFPTG